MASKKELEMCTDVEGSTGVLKEGEQARDTDAKEEQVSRGLTSESR